MQRQALAPASAVKRDYFALFIQSRQAMQVTEGTLEFYRVKLGRFLSEVAPNTAQREDIERYLIQFENPGNRNAHYRAARTFFNWREETFGLPSTMRYMKAPKIPKVIPLSRTREEVLALIDATDNVRNKAFISLATESGLRLSEATDIKLQDIDWGRRIIKVHVKGQKQALATFGDMTFRYLKEWLARYQPDGNIWGLNKWGIISMLRRLEKHTGIACNPHVFRRTFACLLRQSGLDVLTIKDLGRWETVAMVEHYTRSIGFQDSLKFYKGPLSGD